MAGRVKPIYFQLLVQPDVDLQTAEKFIPTALCRGSWILLVIRDVSTRRRIFVKKTLAIVQMHRKLAGEQF